MMFGLRSGAAKITGFAVPSPLMQRMPAKVV
jgi:hypothetical protein